MNYMFKTINELFDILKEKRIISFITFFLAIYQRLIMIFLKPVFRIFNSIKKIYFKFVEKIGIFKIISSILIKAKDIINNVVFEKIRKFNN